MSVLRFGCLWLLVGCLDKVQPASSGASAWDDAVEEDSPLDDEPDADGSATSGGEDSSGEETSGSGGASDGETTDGGVPNDGSSDSGSSDSGSSDSGSSDSGSSDSGSSDSGSSDGGSSDGGSSDGGSSSDGEASDGGTSDGAEEGSDDEPIGLAVLGAGSTSIVDVDFRHVGDAEDGLNVPRDLAFNPDVPGELWVVNRTDDSVSIFSDVGTTEQSSRHVIDPFAMHFMDEVSSIAFGAAMHAPSSALNFATCQESINTYDGATEGNYFMGPTLWSSDPDIFGLSDPDAVSYLTSLYGYYTDLGSHLDMLHQSPLCVGIAHDYDNVYWVFDGHNESIYRYDFQEDHGPGMSDHDDGIMARYVEGQVGYEPDIPSHMFLDTASRLLYIADTGNNRVAVLDTESGEEGMALERAEEPGTTHYEMVGATLSTFIDGEDVGMVAPSGIDMVDGILFVTDNETSEIIAFDMEGEEIDRLDTRLEPGSLMGIAVRSLEDIWLVSATEDRIYRLQPALE